MNGIVHISVVLVASLLPITTLQAAEFTLLGDLPDGNLLSQSNAVSDDGKLEVGFEGILESTRMASEASHSQAIGDNAAVRCTGCSDITRAIELTRSYGEATRAVVPFAKIELPTGETAEFELTINDRHGVDVVRGVDKEGRRLLMAVGGGAYRGSIHSRAEAWDIGSTAGLAWIEQRGPATNSLTDDVIEPSPGVTFLSFGAESLRGTIQDASLDLLLLYTPELAVEFGADGLITHFVFLVELLNDVLSDSDVPYAYRLAGIEESAISNDTNTFDAVAELRFDEATLNQRDAYGADVVMLIRKKTLTNGLAGAAFLFQGPDRFPSESAFGISHLGCERKDGSVSCGSDGTFLHEMGHIMGGHHADGIAPWKPYGHAFHGCGRDIGGFQQSTLVGNSGFRVRVYSNPAIVNEGFLCGDPLVADNARLFRESLPYISQFRTPPPTAVAPTVKLLLTPGNADLYTSAHMSWFSTHADACTASGDWFGKQQLHGRERIFSPEPGTYTFTLTCTGPGGTASDTRLLVVSPREPTFADVGSDHWAILFVEQLVESGITAGCGGNLFCPEDAVTRAQMAVFLVRGMHLNDPLDLFPLAATGEYFLDVGVNDFAADFIEQLFAEGITAGCGNHNYCPNELVTRAQMAVFLLRAKYGAGYTPPPAAGHFADVPPGSFADAWIEQLAAEGITAGCGNGNYCPDDPVTRAQMAVFLVRTFGLR